MQLRPDLQAVISRAGLMATTRGHATITAEHLLCSLLEDKEIARLVEGVGADLAQLWDACEQVVDALDPRLRSTKFAPSVTAIVVLHRALMDAPPGRARELSPTDAFLALFEPPVSRATQLLAVAKVEKSAVLSLVGREQVASGVYGAPLFVTSGRV